MPWKTIKRDCKQSSGKKGSHVVVKVKKGGGTEHNVSNGGSGNNIQSRRQKATIESKVSW